MTTTTPKTKTPESLGQYAARLAMDAALDYLRRRKALGLVDLDVLTARLREQILPGLDEALRDAREALECGMEEVASTTFAAGMALTGIKAAKLALGEAA